MLLKEQETQEYSTFVVEIADYEMLKPLTAQRHARDLLVLAAPGTHAAKPMYCLKTLRMNSLARDKRQAYRFSGRIAQYWMLEKNLNARIVSQFARESLN
jgi:hypothetical protein